MFQFSLCLLSETFFIPRRNEWDMIKNIYWFSCKVLLFLSDFKKTLILTDFKKILKTKFHGNPTSGRWAVPHGRTYMMKLTVTSKILQMCWKSHQVSPSVCIHKISAMNTSVNCHYNKVQIMLSPCHDQTLHSNSNHSDENLAELML